MDDPLRLIQYLYDEEVDDPTFARRLTEDETLYREYERLRATKEDLDNRSSRRPDPAVVDQVVDQARTAAQESTASPSSPNDRPPRRPFPTWTRRLQTVSAGLALVLLVGLGWWREGGLVGDPMEGSSESAQQAPPTVVEGREQDEQSIPTWDDSDELVRIHRRLEQIQTHSASNAWGALQSASRTRP
jgi:hypothetical protein